jgi:hypothetical protein
MEYPIVRYDNIVDDDVDNNNGGVHHVDEVVGHAPQFNVRRGVRSDVCAAIRLDQVGRHHVARPHCNGGNGSDGRGTMAPASPIAPCAVVRRGIDKFIICPILSMLLLLLIIIIINPLPCEAVSDRQFQGQVWQAQQRCDIGLAGNGGTCEDYDQQMVLMSSMQLLLLPWRMSGWSMMFMLCLDIVLVSIQQKFISHRG